MTAIGGTGIDVSVLKASFSGRVATPADDDFESLVLGGLWNQRRPSRRPQIIAQVAAVQDVIEAVRFANSRDLKVVARGGGHNWCNPSVRTGGMLIDLTRLDQVVSIDTEARSAVVEPVISNRDLQRILNTRGLAFPTGHCPEVKLSGYLLGGGMAWNQGSWGSGTSSVSAVELVTPAGDLITASEEQHRDYFWAARGAGSGLFAVAVRFHLKLYPLPKAIMARSFYCQLGDAEAVAGWLAATAPGISSTVELSLFMLHAPPELADRCEASNGKVCLVTAAAFSDSQSEGRAALEPLNECPVVTFSENPPAPTSFDELFDASGALWPELQRANVDAMFYNANPAELANAVGGHFVHAPSATTVLLFTLFTGPHVPAPLPDAAFSMSARVYGGPWTMWADAADDPANSAWHAECVERLKPHAIGHYVSESDTVSDPERARRGYSAANWERLSKLRSTYDPDGVFFSYSDGLT